MTDPRIVGVWEDASLRYGGSAPFDPPERFPELVGLPGTIDQTNTAYGAVRELLRTLGFDARNHGTPEWNPLGWLVSPGQTVFIKPNLIAEKNTARDEWESVITNGAVLRAVIDYVALALRGRGRIQVGDAPQTDSDIARIRQHIGLDEIVRLYQGHRDVSFEFLDLRDEYWPSRQGVVLRRERLGGDPQGTALFDLADDSMFREVDSLGRRYYGAYYDVAETNKHHTGGRHEYKIARSPLAADVFISVPKLKTHKKVGITVNLKSLVGINGDKNYLPHYALGDPSTNGDQFPAKKARGRLENLVVLAGKRALAAQVPLLGRLAGPLKSQLYKVFGSSDTTVRSGNWWGNDTCWRMSLDLNRLLLFGRPDGTFGDTPKPYFSLVDGLVGMEGNGPVAGEPKRAGMLLAGSNPASVDAAAARLMGFAPERLTLIRRAFDTHRLPVVRHALDEIELVSNVAAYRGPLRHLAPSVHHGFAPHFAWKGHMEVG